MSDKVDDNISEKGDIETNVEAEKEEVKQDLLMYSKDDLMQLRTAVISQKWPSYLDEAFKNNRGTWDPDRWHQNKKRGSTPPPSDDRTSDKGSKKDEINDSGVNKKKDIKDRLFMSETEGVVLSPQRRSFTTGCQMNKDPPKDADNPSGNSSNTASKSSSQDRGERGDHRSERGSGASSSLRSDSMSNANSRRVGSGRIRPSASTSEEYEGGPSSRDQRGGGGRSNYGERGDSASGSRCGFNRGVDRGDRGGWYDRDFDKGGGSSRRGDGGRNMASSRKILSEQPSDSRKNRGHRDSRRSEEPEWMTATINQDDTFELKGFDDSPEKEAKAFRSEIERKGIPQAKAPAKSVDQPQESANVDNPNSVAVTSDSTSGNGGFNMDDILHMDVIPGLSTILDDCNDPLMETGGESMPTMDSAGGGSRFSQFFTSEVRATSGEQQPQGQQQRPLQPQPRKDLEHSRSSITDEVLGNVINNNNKNQRDDSPNAFMHQLLRTQNQKHHEEQQTSIKIPSPGDPSACFAPISPAAKTETPPMPPSQPEIAINPIMEMLRAGNAKTESELLGGQKAPPLPQMSEAKTAAELEATIKQRIGLQQRNDQPLPSSSHHSAAEPRKMSPQPQQSDAGEMSAFKKFAAMMQGSNGLEKQNGNTSQPNDMNHHQQAHQGQDQHGGVGGGHHHHQQHHGQNQTGSHPQAHPQSIQRGPVIRPSPIPANAPTEHDILAEMQTPMTRPQHPEAVAAGGFPPRMQHPGPGIQPSRDDVLMMAARRHLIPELLKTSEAVSLQTAVQNQGMNMLNTILFQFVYGQMEPQRREILLQVIKYYQMKGAFGPQFANPHFANPNFLNIQDSVSPTSPTPSGGNGKNNVTTGGNGTGSGNLSVSPLPGREQRVPSPQEIAIHTQQIMQNALIKRKLEEQKEKAARQRQHQEVDRRSTDSPSFAFTPTVVMKKMAADRRDSDPKPVIPELKVSTQPSVAPSEKPAQPSGGGAMNLQNRHSPGGIQGMMPPPRPMPPSAQQLLFMQQQIRAQQQLAAFQSGRPVDPRVLMHAQAIMGAAPPPGSVQGPPGGHAAGPRPLAPTSVPHFMPPDVMQHQQHQALHGHPAQGGLSRFFSPEVLAQAQSGNAPPLPPLPTQKAMTLEEIERQAAAVRM